MFNQHLLEPFISPGSTQWSAQQAMHYWIDAWQRSVLTLDTLRERGNIYQQHSQSGKPPVLVFGYTTILDAREFELPANYALVSITPPADHPTDLSKRPFVVIDPRAGHGPGIGGFKPDSEIGVALKAGHPCYFFSFFPEPMPGQTIEAVARAEIKFLQHVCTLHPGADNKPFVIGNCQGGWALLLLASAQPEAVGPILLAGAPVEYWSGVEGKHPMRYSGGLMGGSWLASLSGDLGNGKFDGAQLVSNFENLNPANTYWKKLYNLYAQVDTERERFLDFERWWGGHYLMNKAEMDWIVQNLFVGNRLARGGVQTADGSFTIDLRKIRSPIIVFASWGDNITPPQQALNWIADLYVDCDEIRAHEQTIVYCLHPNIGHLGIFVSSSIAKKETTEIIAALDLIDTLPPGLYEMVISDSFPGMSHLELTDGRYLTTFHPRQVADILALDDGREDEAAFEVARRVAEINQSNYDTFASPVVKALVSEPTAQLARKLNPARMERWMMSDTNPALWPVKMIADEVRQQRQTVDPDNPFVKAEQAGSALIEQTLNAYRDARDVAQEQLFISIYHSPILSAALGTTAANAVQTEPELQAIQQVQSSQQAQASALLPGKSNDDLAWIKQGSDLDAGVRMLIYIASDDSGVDERPLRLMQNLLKETAATGGVELSMADLKRSVKLQHRALLLDTERALAALPDLLPEAKNKRMVFLLVRKIVRAQGMLSASHAERLAQIAGILNLDKQMAILSATDDSEMTISAQATEQSGEKL